MFYSVVMSTQTKERQGGVYELGQVIDPDLATQIGARAISLKDEYLKRNYGLGFGTGIGLNICEERAKDDSELTPYTNGVLLGEEDTQIVDEANVHFRSYVDATNLDTGNMDSGFFIGAAAGGRWHLDVMRDWRMLVNLSRFPISIRVAEVWDHKDWVSNAGYPIWETKTSPRSFTTVKYGPGEAVVVDNACSLRYQVPHVGSTEEDKVFLRTIIDEEYDNWS